MSIYAPSPLRYSEGPFTCLDESDEEISSEKEALHSPQEVLQHLRLDSTQEEKFSFAFQLFDHSPECLWLHYERFVFTLDQKKGFALFLLQQNIHLSFYIHHLHIEDEGARKELALKELLLFPIQQETVSPNISNYQLSDGSLFEVANEAAKKGYVVAKYFDLYHLHDEECRFHLLEMCCDKIPRGYEGELKELHLEYYSLEKRQVLVQKLARGSEYFLLFERDIWTSFAFDRDTSDRILFSLAQEVSQRNPELLYEHMDHLVLSHERKEVLKQSLPLFDALRRIQALPSPDSLKKMTYQSCSPAREQLVSILHELHERNKTEVIPLSLCCQLVSKTKGIVASCQTMDELLELCALFNREFFSLTSELQRLIYSKASKELFPDINQYVELSFLSNTRAPLYTQIYRKGIPILTPEALYRIAKAKVESLIGKVFFPPVFCATEMATKLQEFYHSEKLKGFFLLNFSQTLHGHYSPLIVERKEDVLHILNSDSVFRGSAPFTERLLVELEKLPFPKEVYIVPEGRQSDEWSCSMFAMSDITEAAKTMQREGSLFEYLRQRGPLPSHLGSDHIHILPFEYVPNCMKMAQSMTKINRVACSAPTLRKKSGEEVSLERYAESHRYWVNLRFFQPKPFLFASSVKLLRLFEKILEKAAHGTLPQLATAQADE